MQYRDLLLQLRARCIAVKFQQRTANEVETLSRERIREIIQGVVAELDEEHSAESHARELFDGAAGSSPQDLNQAAQISRA